MDQFTYPAGTSSKLGRDGHYCQGHIPGIPKLSVNEAGKKMDGKGIDTNRS